MGRFADALKDFESAVQLEPDNEEFKEGLSKCRDSVETWNNISSKRSLLTVTLKISQKWGGNYLSFGDEINIEPNFVWNRDRIVF